MQLPLRIVLMGSCCWIVFVFMEVTPFCVVSRWVGAHCAKRREWVRLPRPRDAFGEGPEESPPCLLRRSLFGEEPEKQRPAVPQDEGKTPNACPTQRRTQTGDALNTHAAWLPFQRCQSAHQ